MAERFKKYLCVSSATSRFSGVGITLDRFSWKDISGIKNLSDYDGILLNLTSLEETGKTKAFESVHLGKVFDPAAWADVIACNGRIVIVGDPCCSVPTQDADEEERNRIKERDANRAEPSPLSRCPARLDPVVRHQMNPVQMLLDVEKDNRPFEFRRIIHNDRSSYTERFYKHLESVLDWEYSLARVNATDEFKAALKRVKVPKSRSLSFGVTTYHTVLAIEFDYVYEHGQNAGALTILPSSGRGTEVEDSFILREVFGIATALPEPAWVGMLRVPGQTEIEAQIAEKREAVSRLQQELTASEESLKDCKRWFRLLYDDGDSLEAIVKESFEVLGAQAEKKSKEKEDYRVRVPEYPLAVMEVKGTHNPKFKTPALRELAHWMDEVNAAEGVSVKGILVGNGGRNDEPQNRVKLFEPNCEGYAQTKDIVILRSMDLFCLVVLKQLDLLDTKGLWKDMFACKGSFDAAPYLILLPKEFQFQAKQKAPDKKPL
jgi:hypothetical protein